MAHLCGCIPMQYAFVQWLWLGIWPWSKHGLHFLPRMCQKLPLWQEVGLEQETLELEPSVSKDYLRLSVGCYYTGDRPGLRGWTRSPKGVGLLPVVMADSLGQRTRDCEFGPVLSPRARCLLMDLNLLGSLSLWHSLPLQGQPLNVWVLSRSFLLSSARLLVILSL